MNIKKKTHITMKVLIHIALNQKTSNELMDIRKIASDLNVSYEHTRKIITDLIELDIIKSRRGRGGGIYLSKDPSTIHIYDILLKIEDVQMTDFIHDCSNCNMPIDCKFRHMLKEQQKVFFESFKHTYLSDFIPLKQIKKRTII